MYNHKKYAHAFKILHNCEILFCFLEIFSSKQVPRLAFQKKERGCGYWKLNCSMLSNIDFVKKINQTIVEVIEKGSSDHPSITWEKMKKKVAEESIKFCKKAKSEKQVAISQLFEKIGDMEERMDLTEIEGRYTY